MKLLLTYILLALGVFLDLSTASKATLKNTRSQSKKKFNGNIDVYINNKEYDVTLKQGAKENVQSAIEVFSSPLDITHVSVGVAPRGFGCVFASTSKFPMVSASAKSVLADEFSSRFSLSLPGASGMSTKYEEIISSPVRWRQDLSGVVPHADRMMCFVKTDRRRSFVIWLRHSSGKEKLVEVLSSDGANQGELEFIARGGPGWGIESAALLDSPESWHHCLLHFADGNGKKDIPLSRYKPIKGIRGFFAAISCYGVMED